MQISLPEIKNLPLLPEYFPTVMQAFIFRNWNMVSKYKIAEVLNTNVDNVVLQAERMGLKEQGNAKLWNEKGYITIIRANWHLLPYEQLLKLLDWTEEKLALILKEEDFLDIKLGRFKPECEPVIYRELTQKELELTQRIKNIVTNVRTTVNEEKQPFDFWKEQDTVTHINVQPKDKVVLDDDWCIADMTNDTTVAEMVKRFINDVKNCWNIDLQSEGNKNIVLSYIENQVEEYHEITVLENKITIKAGSGAGIVRGLYRLEDLAKKSGGAYFDLGVIKRSPRFAVRYIYPFSALYEGAFDVDSRSYCPDVLLEKYARAGVNGIWLHAVLYRLTEFLFAPSFSQGWEIRQKNLKELVKRAKSYGIKIYLYLNEPRSMPLSFFEKYPDMKGTVLGNNACMCLSLEKTQNYLKNAVESLCRAVPGLGGFFTITMSENLTHCKSVKSESICPDCADKEPWELASMVNRLIEEGAHRIDQGIRVLAWDWAWTENFGFTQNEISKCINALPENTAVLCKRETGIPFVRGGIEGRVKDYSISVDGISSVSLANWQMAKKAGRETAVKLQINNSWECSTVPYLPVFASLIRQIENLKELQIDHLMLSWTLGGYPSPNIKLIAEAFFIENGENNTDYTNSFKIMYGKDAPKVKKATDVFSEAFSEFPFDIQVLYLGPQNGGVSNIFYSKPTGYEATMTCFSYDDLESWRSIYPAEIFEKQFKLLSEKWFKGIEILGDMKDELPDIAYVAYSLFRSSYHQIRFVRLRDKYLKSKNSDIKKEILTLVNDEKDIAEKVYKIMCRRPEVGFEAANHYYYSADMVLEKIINCESLLRFYDA
ncbi:MAG: hypothetical protein IKW59_06870 [Clostridia bacterium]|nr:hypothetical protein [Clostridia bacterium]